MNAPNAQRKEISQFLAKNTSSSWRIREICSMPRAGVFDIHLFKMDRYSHTILLLRIFALNAIDYAIRPRDPNIIEGGPPLKFSTDDPRLDDRHLQLVPGGDGEVFQPPRRYQLLELDQSWIIAERFEVEELRQTISLWNVQGRRDLTAQ